MNCFFAVYARNTVKQNAKGNKEIKMQEVVYKGRTGRGEREEKREGLKGCTRIIIITLLLLVLVLSEIMSWQGLLQVFTGATTNLDIGWWQI